MVTRMNRVRNVEVSEALGQEAVIEIVKEKQRNWMPKLEQMSKDRLVKTVYMEEARGHMNNPEKMVGQFPIMN